MRYFKHHGAAGKEALQVRLLMTRTTGFVDELKGSTPSLSSHPGLAIISYYQREAEAQ